MDNHIPDDIKERYQLWLANNKRPLNKPPRKMETFAGVPLSQWPGWKKYYKAWVAEHRDELRAYYREYNRERYQTHREQEQARRKRWADKNQDKIKAHRAVQAALKRKKNPLVKLPCGVCGALKVNAHHEDYSKPLEVIWLCPVHHSAAHNGVAQSY